MVVLLSKRKNHLEGDKRQQFSEQHSRPFKFLHDFLLSSSPTIHINFFFSFFAPLVSRSCTFSLRFHSFLCTRFCRILCSFGDINAVRSCLFIALQASTQRRSSTCKSVSLFASSEIGTSLLILFSAPRIPFYLFPFRFFCLFLSPPVSLSLSLIRSFVSRRYPLAPFLYALFRTYTVERFVMG